MFLSTFPVRWESISIQFCKCRTVVGVSRVVRLRTWSRVRNVTSCSSFAFSSGVDVQDTRVALERTCPALRTPLSLSTSPHCKFYNSRGENFQLLKKSWCVVRIETGDHWKSPTSGIRPYLVLKGIDRKVYRCTQWTTLPSYLGDISKSIRELSDLLIYDLRYSTVEALWKTRAYKRWKRNREEKRTFGGK